MKQLKNAAVMFAMMTLLTGIIYPLLITGVGQALFRSRANGSLVQKNGLTVGSSLIGQGFVSAGYFRGRPSAVNYDAACSGASNDAPASRALVESVRSHVDSLRLWYNLPTGQTVPADLVTYSGSGLDPDISLEGAMLQVPQIAAQRNLNATELYHLLASRSQQSWLGFGQARINVLMLNMALDSLARE